MSEDDAAVVRVQLGRAPRGVIDVSRRCHLRLPVVIAVPPNLASGEPFPTRQWLTCPLARRRISRLEAEGGVKEFEQRLVEDADFRASVHRAHLRYAAERDALLRGDEAIAPSGGVGGVADMQGVKCLHAHYADHAAGGANPLGREVASSLGDLDCVVPCVYTDGVAVRRNLDWVEPREKPSTRAGRRRRVPPH